MTLRNPPLWVSFCAVVTAVTLFGCADITVTKVTDANRATVKGQRYFLPKPAIIVAPQADGTIGVSVEYLPDASHEYAIDTSSCLSSYAYQAVTDIRGLLTQVEYKADTAVVGQQLATSAGEAAVQMANHRASQLMATQTAVDSAQTGLDTAQGTLDAAQAALESDQKHHASPDTITKDAAAVAQARAKLIVARNALDRARDTSRVVAAGASTGSVVKGSALALGKVAEQPAWTSPSAIDLPDKFGPVIFLVNDDLTVDSDGKPKEVVALVAQTSKLSGAGAGTKDELHKGVVPEAQPTFETTSTALGPPSLLPPSQIVPAKAKSVTFFFDRPIKEMGGAKVATDTKPPVPAKANVKPSDDKKSINVDVSQLKPGEYVLSVTFSYTVDAEGNTMSAVDKVKFTIK